MKPWSYTQQPLLQSSISLLKRLVPTVGLAVLLSATAASAQQGSSNANPDHTKATASTAQSVSLQTPAWQGQNKSSGGSPDSASPGRTTVATPSQVQQALDKQLPAGDQVTASVADDGRLKLTGTVKSESDKSNAEQIAKQSSNKDVDNQIEVKAGANSAEKGANPK